MQLLLHITTPAEWEAAQATGIYRPPSLDSEGFIHCSLTHQVVAVANAQYRGRHDLVLLCINEAAVHAPVVFEVLGAPKPFPHIYGPLNVEAVIKVVPLKPKADGSFTLPTELPDL